MRHAHACEDGFAGVDVQQAATIGLVLAPAAGGIGPAEAGDEFYAPVDDGHAVEVAAILGGELADEGRAPAGHEAVHVVERAKARESRVNGPEFAADPANLMDADVACDMAGAREKGGVVAFLGWKLRGDGGLVEEMPDFVPCADGEAPGAGIVGQAHRAEEIAEVSVERVAIGAHDD
jgi:hypothetical protein